MKQITPLQLDQLARQAQASPRRRANLNLHPQLHDSVQRLAIAMEPDTYVRPHRHPHTFEILYPLRGRFVVLYFDEGGVVTARCVLGEGASVVEHDAGQWHAVLSLDQGGVIFETKLGPYTPIAEGDYATWSSADGKAELAWYARAKIGDRLI